MENTRRFKCGRGFFFVPFFLLAIFGIGYLVMFLWNAILPEVAHLSPLSYWQAMGLLLLCRILFGGFRFRGMSGRGPSFANRKSIQESFMKMTDEERAAFRQKWKQRCSK
jgi:hypothetical protein